MKFINTHNVPEHILNWLTVDEYDHQADTLSATTLISSPRIWALKQIHADELVRDCTDMLKIRLGTAIHDSLEKNGAFSGDGFKEKRFFVDFNNFRITGKMDMVFNGVIRDIKSTSVWKYVQKDFDDYIKQLSIYKWILFKNGIETAAYAFIDFFFTDWKKSDALKSRDYPQILYKEQKITLWDVQKTEEYISDRIEKFAFARLELPLCSREELWQTDDIYAVMKHGAARATKCFNNAADAEAFAAEKGLEVVKRPGKAKHCSYCDCCQFCDQYKELKEAGLIEGES